MNILKIVQALRNPAAAGDLIKGLQASQPDVYAKIMGAQISKKLQDNPGNAVATFTLHDEAILIRYTQAPDGTFTRESSPATEPLVWTSLDDTEFDRILRTYTLKIN